MCAVKALSLAVGLLVFASPSAAAQWGHAGVPTDSLIREAVPIKLTREYKLWYDSTAACIKGQESKASIKPNTKFKDIVWLRFSRQAPIWGRTGFGRTWTSDTTVIPNPSVRDTIYLEETLKGERLRGAVLHESMHQLLGIERWFMNRHEGEPLFEVCAPWRFRYSDSTTVFPLPGTVTQQPDGTFVSRGTSWPVIHRFATFSEVPARPWLRPTDIPQGEYFFLLTYGERACLVDFALFHQVMFGQLVICDWRSKR